MQDLHLAGVATIKITQNMEPIDIFNLFLTDDIIQLLIEQTNKYALGLQHKKRLEHSARISRWHNTDREEMKTFLGK